MKAPGFSFDDGQDQFVALLANQVYLPNGSHYYDFITATVPQGQIFGKFLESFFAIVPFSS